MRHLIIILALFLAALTFADSVSCPTTDTSTSLTDVPVWAPVGPRRAWYGTEKLAVLISVDGHWARQLAAVNYSDKLWWYSKGYVPRDDPFPELS